MVVETLQAEKTNPQNMYLFMLKLMTTPSREEGVQYGHLSTKWLVSLMESVVMSLSNGFCCWQVGNLAIALVRLILVSGS